MYLYPYNKIKIDYDLPNHNMLILLYICSKNELIALIMDNFNGYKMVNLLSMYWYVLLVMLIILVAYLIMIMWIV